MPAPSGGGMSACTLHREINALGGAPDGEWSKGYNEAIGDVLNVLERRGFSEAADASTEVVEALTYYATDEHYDSGDVPGHIYVLDDHGRTARAALAKATGK